MASLRTLCFPLLWGLIGVIATGTTAVGQDSSCTYERCALAYADRFWGLYVVKGQAAERVARMGFFTPRIAPLEGRTDSAGAYYDRFRASYASGNVLALVGGLALGVGYVLATERPNEVVLPLVSIGVGGVVGILGVTRGRRARNALHRAIWWYNGSLPH